MTKEKKRKAWRFLIGYSLIPIITFISGIVYFMNENSYIFRLIFFFSMVALLIQLFVTLIWVLVVSAEESAERDVENIRRIIKG